MPAASSLDASFVIVDEEMKNTHKTKATVKEAHPSTNASYIPGSGSSYAHDWSPQATGGELRIHGRHFIDAYGRVCNLRGVNLSGSSKTPVNHVHDEFPSKDHGTVTFVGRPFPLEEAHEHFSRLRRWGLTALRFLVTWEAVEHEGPGIYDTEYLEYLQKLLSLLPQYGMTAWISIHQDVWSRYSGGSGAPAWTLEAVGFDLHSLEASGAAWLHGMRGGGHKEEERGVWPCGYTKLAAATMATCFWAGDTFAPKLKAKDRSGKDVPIQQFLQNAFLAMNEVLAKAVGNLPGVLGFQILNEPHPGYIAVKSLYSFNYNTDLHLAHMPSAFESFQLGAGHSVTVPFWTRSFPVPTRKTAQELMNPEGHKAWREDGPTHGQCLWEMHGVWGWDKDKKQGVILREHYFKNHPITDKKVDWYTDFYFPYVKKWAETIHNASSSDKLLFIEAIPNEFAPKSWTKVHRPKNMVYAPHWYDLNALFAKAFGNFTVDVQSLSRGAFPPTTFYWGQKGARDNYGQQIRNIVQNAYKSLGETPVLVGECGIPMDMNSRKAFETGDFTWQKRMMDAMLTALEQAMVGFTLWNYNPLNDDHTGDDWNGENFSWFSKKRALPASLLYYDQDAPTLDNGGRILDAVVRPYPGKTAGIPVCFNYEMTTGRFTFVWQNPSGVPKAAPTESKSKHADAPLPGHPPLSSLETEIFLPSMLTTGRKIKVEGLEAKDSYRYDEKRQTLFIVARDTTPEKLHQLTVSVHPRPDAGFVVHDFWDDFGLQILGFVFMLLAIATYFLLALL